MYSGTLCSVIGGTWLQFVYIYMCPYTCMCFWTTHRLYYGTSMLPQGECLVAGRQMLASGQHPGPNLRSREYSDEISRCSRTLDCWADASPAWSLMCCTFVLLCDVSDPSVHGNSWMIHGLSLDGHWQRLSWFPWIIQPAPWESTYIIFSLKKKYICIYIYQEWSSSWDVLTFSKNKRIQKRKTKYSNHMLDLTYAFLIIP